ncbi:DNA mismatch repair protein MutS [Acidaminobacterium chupaoyuni]
MAELTPMMQQYQKVKDENQDCILFYRLGDFYEMFFEDAQIASKELELVLTGRDCGQEERAPMCGVPFHSAESYIARLIQKGYKVAICEQMEDPALAKGLVKREVIRKISPGTVIESAMLEENKNNFIAGVYLEGRGAGICFCDISTGEMHASQLTGKHLGSAVISELGRFSPSEVVLSDGAAANGELSEFFKEKYSCHTETLPKGYFLKELAEELVRQHFEPDQALQGELEENPELLLALGGLLNYLHETQKNELKQINKLEIYGQAQFMQLDPGARRNLELCAVMRTGAKKGSLLWVLDHTKTAMGGRLIRQWLEKPLVNVAQIRRRQSAVEALLQNREARDALEEALRSVYDMERLIGRIVFGSANCRDLRSLQQTCMALPQIRLGLQPFCNQFLAELCGEIDPLEDIAGLIDRAIDENPPFSVREGGMIREGYDSEIDELRHLLNGGKDTLAQIEQREREATGIPKLKVGYNKVFGYYIEISKSYASQAPETYIRKQTLTNCERFITPELKELEAKMLSAGERITALEYQVFCRVREEVAQNAHRIQQTAQAVAAVDVLCSFALAAQKQNYVMPDVDYSDQLIIRDGRHPVVECVLRDALFVPNDAALDCGENRVAIITGPNMAGKSTYMRQVALITIMAQCGSFVPAASAEIGVCDRVFTRVGASDDLASGQSTFMVEMSEVADILKNATERSLLILDEIGRGTSTFDGMAIARAVLEYVADKKTLGAKTLFATHYHELSELEELLPGVKNYNIVVKKRGDDITFIRKIVRGGADDSYGIEVAKLAGLPAQVIRRAKAVLAEIEQKQPEKGRAAQQEPQPQMQMTMGSAENGKITQRLKELEPDTLTPIEALGLLYELSKEAKEGS